MVELYGILHGGLVAGIVEMAEGIGNTGNLPHGFRYLPHRLKITP